MFSSNRRGMPIDPKICAVCRGRGFCGLSYCPLIAKKTAIYRLKKIDGSKELFGSSPPAVFVGRHGYPYVNIGPSIPPEQGDTAVYDLPERWLSLRLEDILNYRWSLVTASRRMNVRSVNNPFIDKIHELVLSIKPVDVEALLEKPAKPRLTLSEYEPPIGPRAPLQKLRVVSNPRIPRILDKVYSDKDLPSTEAVVRLYKENLPVSMIQRVFSVGALGRARERRIVPTRWSITAVDSILSDYLLKKIKTYEEINHIEVYMRRHYDNLFVAILYPAKWSFEWMEAWWPGSTWNPGTREVIVEGDYEGFQGRKTYPEIGGCYYATRLAIAEHLYNRKRQATAIVLREIYPGFNLPVGVWFVRENIRAMMRGKPVLRTDDLGEAVSFIAKNTRLGSKKWVSASRLLRRLMYNWQIDKFISKYGVD